MNRNKKETIENGMTRNNKENKTNIKSSERAITLVALVVTIIILLILAGVTIGSITSNGGLLSRTQKAKESYEKGQANEAQALNELESLLENNEYPVADGSWSNVEKVNTPVLKTGMTPIKFTDPTDTVEGETVKTSISDKDWYEYTDKKWANAQTEDGSMWVWIPRYEYKLDTANQKADIKFIKTSQTTADEGYIIHPAFVNESSTNYANGGWDSELPGFWVAKFEAGYASGNNTATVKASSVNYTQSTAYVAAVENGTSSDGGGYDARNWLDKTYGTTTTAIKYPTFQGLTYSMNYIDHNDAFNIAKKLNESGNIYGLSSDSDSHLMKNSEWGAIAYLAQSQYGLNGTNIYINNVNLNNSTTSVYAVTGCSATTADEGNTPTTIETVNKTKTNNSTNGSFYVWCQKLGQQASSSGTIYGIYDLSGGTLERTAAYINNANENLTTYGASIVANGGTSTKYTTVYPSNDSGESNIDTASQKNYALNTHIYGDAVRETSTAGTGSTAWYGDHSSFPALGSPFFLCGGSLLAGSNAGLFYFGHGDGNSYYGGGFRAVLV